MSLIFERIRWCNFMATGSGGNEIVLNACSNTLLTAPNGAGKSNILDAIVFALFGRPHRDINKNQLINSINGKNCLVEIWFKSNSSSYYIRRGMKPNIFEIYRNDELIDQEAATRDYQKFLETQILKTNVKAFTQSVILGAASFTPFMKMRTHERREIIEDFLDIKIFGVMHQILKEEIQITKSESARLDAKLAVAKAQVQGQKNLLTKLVEVNEQSTLVIRDKIRGVETLRESLSVELTINAGKLDELEAKQKGMGEAADTMQRLRDEVALSGHKIETHLGSMKFFRDNTECPACKQGIEDHHRNPIIKDMSEQHEMMMKEHDELIAAFETACNVYDNFLSLNEEIQKIHDRNRELNRRIRDADSSIQSFEDEIDSLTTNDVLNEKEKLKEMALAVVDLLDERTKLSEKRFLQDQSYEILKDGGVKTTIVREYLPIINKMINYYLGVMEFFVEFTLDENFNEIVKSRCRDEFSYASFSEGEKKRIDIAILFAWRQVARMKNSVNCNILLLDEILSGSLDVDGMDAVFKIIEEESRKSNIFVIDHSDHFKEKFDNVINIKKVGDFSVICDLL